MLFNLVFVFYALLYFPYLLLTGRWYKGFGCRFGVFPASIKARLGTSSHIWIHAVSVGEVMAVKSLISQIRSRWPLYDIVLTVTTKTGYELAQKQFSSDVVVLPSPLDLTWVVSSFIRFIHPKIYIVAETEIWPNLFASLKKQNVPIVIINGRISDTSFGRYKLISAYLKGVLNHVSLFCMQSQEDVNRIVELGAREETVLNLGNIKFDDTNVAQEVSSTLTMVSKNPLWIAGSTHPGEEEIILETFNSYKDQCSLIIAPRHVERCDSIIGLIEASGMKAVRFSQITSEPVPAHMVVVIDTIGHLRSLYKKASFVFIGKSLCVGGGHNIIEPALYAKPIIVGPLMHNFRDITALFKANEAIIQLEDASQLKEQVNRLLHDVNLRTELGQRAFNVVKTNQGAVSRTLDQLKTWI